MIIKKLELCNFRNYKRETFQFHSETNVLYGDNAQGKTNVLESIFVAGTTKSHKMSKDREMIQMTEKEGHIRMFVEKEGIPHKIDVHMKKNSSKGIAIDGIPTKKSSDLFGLVHIVFFSPEDLSMIKNGPAERRRFINMELSQLNKIYLHNLTKYNKILLQRNNLLKQIGFNSELMDTLDVWDLQLEEIGKNIISDRRKFIEKLNDIIYKIHVRLTDGKERLEIVYEPNTTEKLFKEKVFLSRNKDFISKTTNTGPHRDDMIVRINGNDLRKYGSQGQQRTAALSLKLAEIEMIKNVAKVKPVLLLDDVLSELDRSRQNTLLENIKGIQTIITCTGLEEFVENGININRTFQIEGGKIVTQEEQIEMEVKHE